MPDGEDRTQIKLHVRTVEFPRRRDIDIDPRWDVSSLRFILINEQTEEVCFATTAPTTGKVKGLCNIGYHYVILNYVERDDSDIERSVSADWLKNAKLRVFRVFPDAQTKVNHFMEDVNIVDLPIVTRPDSDSEVGF